MYPEPIPPMKYESHGGWCSGLLLSLLIASENQEILKYTQHTTKSNKSLKIDANGPL